MIEHAIEKLVQKNNLSKLDMIAVMEEIMSGKVETPQIVSFLTALNNKGETVEEITAAVSVMCKHALKISADESIILDTCGTGGDKLGTFNVSTIVAFVASACGITVAKHGNRSVSSSCGSADILEALGVNINLDRDKLKSCLNDLGIAFLFAPNFHPAMKYAMPARKQMGVKTIFNILGPLSNPAGATHQLVGVYAKQWTEILARVLANLGIVHALVVHGEDGLDEVSTTGKTFISETRNGQVKNYQISPEDFGFKRAKLIDLIGGAAEENASIMLELLNGKPGAKRDLVLLNAGCAIYAADKAGSIEEGIKLAQDAIDSRAALQKLELLKQYTNR